MAIQMNEDGSVSVRAPHHRPVMQGRPSKLTPELIEQITEILALGQSREAACSAVGIHKSTFYSWLQQARYQDGPKKGTLKKSGKYRDFLDAVETAEDKGEFLIVNRLRQKIQEGDVRAMQLWLTTRKPERWSVKTQHEIEHTGDVVLTIPDELGPPKVNDDTDRSVESSEGDEQGIPPAFS